MADTPVKFVRDKVAEQAWLADPAHKAEAAARNMTPEQYLQSRGGINADGYWADSFIEGYTGKSPEEQAQFILDRGLENKVQQDGNGIWLGAMSANGTIARVDASKSSGFLKKNYPTDAIDVMNRLNELAAKSRTGTVGIATDPNEVGREYIGKLTPQEVAEFNFLESRVNDLIKNGAPIYGIPQPDGTTKLSYINPNAAAEEEYRKQNAPDLSLAKAGMAPYQGGKVLNWQQKQQAMNYVEGLRSKYDSLSYSEKQKFDAVQRNLYASIAVNDLNPNPSGATATDIFDNNISALQNSMFKQTGQTGTVNKFVVNESTDANGSTIRNYNDGSTTTTTKDGVTTATSGPTTNATGNTLPTTSNTVGSTTNITNPYAPDTQQYTDFNKRVSAYDTLYNEFNKYGLGSMVERVKGLITDASASPSQFSIALQNTPEYQKRFAANQDRIKAGLQALTPAEYIGLEDQYQNIMRNYGLPASYYSKDTLGTQSGFSKLLANDVSAAELEDRIATAQQRVQNSNPEVLQALRQFYPDISNADILSYALDPQNALTNIKRKVTAAEIGGAALAQGLQAQGGTAESLAGYGITKAQAQQGYANVAEMLPRGSQLADIYGQQPYTQQTAEAEVFNTAGAADAAARRKKLTALEQAQFGGSSGVGALGRDKALYAGMQGQAGLY